MFKKNNSHSRYKRVSSVLTPRRPNGRQCEMCWRPTGASRSGHLPCEFVCVASVCEFFVSRGRKMAFYLFILYRFPCLGSHKGRGAWRVGVRWPVWPPPRHATAPSPASGYPLVRVCARQFIYIHRDFEWDFQQLQQWRAQMTAQTGPSVPRLASEAPRRPSSRPESVAPSRPARGFSTAHPACHVLFLHAGSP